MQLLKVVAEDKLVVLEVQISQTFLKTFLVTLEVEEDLEVEEAVTIEDLIYDMIYQLLLKKHIKEKNKIYNFQPQKSVTLAKEMVLNLVIRQIDVPIVVEMEK